MSNQIPSNREIVVFLKQPPGYSYLNLKSGLSNNVTFVFCLHVQGSDKSYTQSYNKQRS